MPGREALKSVVKFLTGACVTALLLHMPAQAADATGYGGFKVSDPSGSHPVRPLPPPPPPPWEYTKDGEVILKDSDVIIKDGALIYKGGPEKGGYIGTKDGIVTKDSIVTRKKTSSGARVQTLTDRRTGVKWVHTLDPDGSTAQEVRGKDGGVISRVGRGKNGKLTEYEPWVTDQVFDSAQRVLEIRYHSVGGRTAVNLQSPDKAILGGSNVVVRSYFRSRSKSSSSTASEDIESEDIRLKTEIRKFGPGSRFFVLPVGDPPIRASGWGNTRDEAIASALEQIASRIRTDIRSETVDYQASTRSRTTESDTEIIEEELDARSKAAFKMYEVTAFMCDGDKCTASVTALPGMVVPASRR